jgi:hypothetical protein
MCDHRHWHVFAYNQHAVACITCLSVPCQPFTQTVNEAGWNTIMGLNDGANHMQWNQAHTDSGS